MSRPAGARGERDGRGTTALDASAGASIPLRGLFPRSPVAAFAARAGEPPPERPLFAWTEQPANRWQRWGYLLAGLALERTYRIPTPNPGDGFFTDDRALFEAQLHAVWESGSTLVIARGLSDAMVWRAHSALAQQMLPKLTGYFGREFGLRIDPGAATITVDPRFRPAVRESARIEFLHQLRTVSLRRAAAAALRAHGHSPAAAETIAAGLTAPRTLAESDRVQAALTEAGVGSAAAVHVSFVAAYLGDQLGGTDLAHTPVLVDLATEAREHIQSQLLLTHDGGEWSSFARDTGLLADPDRSMLLETLSQPEQDTPVLWPGQVSRADLELLLHQHAETVAELHAYAAHLTERPAAEIDPVEHLRITTAAEHTTALVRVGAELAGHGDGLLDIERQHALLEIAASELGAPEPRLRFVGELHKWRVEVPTANQRTREDLAARCRDELITEITRSGADITPGRIDSGTVAVDIRARDIESSIRELARWDADPARARLNHERAAAGLDRDLAAAGMAAGPRAQIQALLGGYADQASTVAAEARRRDSVWEVRLGRISVQQSTNTSTVNAAITAALPHGPGPGAGTMPPPGVPGPQRPGTPGPDAGPAL